MGKNVQISEDLFYAMVTYTIDHQDPQDARFQYIYKEMIVKMHALAARQIYTKYKTGLTEDDRQAALERYLKYTGRCSFQKQSQKEEMS